jgi:hypothetical protein
MDDIKFPIFQSELTELFGRPNKNASWLTFIDLTQYREYFRHVSGYWEKSDDGKWGFTGHELLQLEFPSVIETLIARNLIGELKTFDGCFNIRKMTSGRSYSVHSWGLALDFNAADNSYGSDWSFSDEYYKAWADHGWECGSLWNTPDGMHCQLPWTADWRKRSSGIYTPKMNFIEAGISIDEGYTDPQV